MKHTVWILCGVTVLAASAGAAPPGDRKLYKWVDDQGVTHFGDHIPPEYANKEQHVINSQGVETGHIDAQKSADQMAAEEQKRLDAEQSAARDKNLLITYSTVTEIERLRDQRLALLTDQIKVTGSFLEVLNVRLKKLRATASHFKPYSPDAGAPAMPDQLAEDLVRVDNDIHTQQENLREKRSEETTMRRQFESDIARFKELKGIH